MISYNTLQPGEPRSGGLYLYELIERHGGIAQGTVNGEMHIMIPTEQQQDEFRAEPAVRNFRTKSCVAH